MKKTKKEIVSLLVAVVVVASMMGALFWQRSREPEPQEEAPTPTGAVQIVQRTEAELVSVTFKRQDRVHVMLPFVDENDRREWMWEGVDYILDTANARNKIRGAFSLFSNQVVHEDVAEAGIDLADFGLDPPYLTITVVYDDVTTTNIYLGGPTIDLGWHFVMIEGDPRLHTITRPLADRFMFGLEDIIDRRLPHWHAESTEYMLVAQRDREIIEFGMEEHHEFEDFMWLVMQQPFPGREVHTMALEHHLFDHFGAFALGDLVNLHPTNFADYGLADPSLEFIYRAPHGEIHLLFGDIFFREINGNEVAFIYVKFADRPHVFEALYEPVSFLFDMNILRFIERFIAIVNIQDVERMEVLTPSGDFDIHINHIEDTTDIAPTINDNPVDDSEFRMVYRLIIGIGMDGEIEPFMPQGVALYTIRYFMIDDDDIELRLFNYNDNFFAVSVNGEDAWFITNRRNFDMFIGRLAEMG